MRPPLRSLLSFSQHADTRRCDCSRCCRCAISLRGAGSQRAGPRSYFGNWRGGWQGKSRHWPDRPLVHLHRRGVVLGAMGRGVSLDRSSWPTKLPCANRLPRPGGTRCESREITGSHSPAKDAHLAVVAARNRWGGCLVWAVRRGSGSNRKRSAKERHRRYGWACSGRRIQPTIGGPTSSQDWHLRRPQLRGSCGTAPRRRQPRLLSNRAVGSPTGTSSRVSNRQMRWSELASHAAVVILAGCVLWTFFLDGRGVSFPVRFTVPR